MVVIWGKSAVPDVLIAFMDSRNLCFFIANWMLRWGIIGKPSWNDGSAESNRGICHRCTVTGGRKSKRTCRRGSFHKERPGHFSMISIATLTQTACPVTSPSDKLAHISPAACITATACSLDYSHTHTHTHTHTHINILTLLQTSKSRQCLYMPLCSWLCSLDLWCMNY